MQALQLSINAHTSQNNDCKPHISAVTRCADNRAVAYQSVDNPVHQFLVPLTQYQSIPTQYPCLRCYAACSLLAHGLLRAAAAGAPPSPDAGEIAPSECTSSMCTAGSVGADAGWYAPCCSMCAAACSCAIATASISSVAMMVSSTVSVSWSRCVRKSLCTHTHSVTHT